MSQQTLKYAVIGTGGIANWHINAITSQPGVVFAGAADVNPAALEALVRKHSGLHTDTDFTAMLKAVKPDIVSVCTPNKFHREATLAALKAGAHVACEKPMAMDLAEAVSMEKARAKAGRLGLINFSYRNCDSFRFARRMVADGELGTITRVNAVYLQSWLGGEQEFSWRHDASVAGFGALGDLGVHMIDGVRYITGLDARSVTGRAQVLVPTRRDREGRERKVTADTNAAFLAELSNGALAVYETSQVAPGYGNHFRIEISGTKGTLTVLSERGDEIAWHGGGAFAASTTWKTSIPWTAVPTAYPGQRTPKTPEALVHAARGEDVSYGTFADGVAAQRVLEAIGRAAKSGRWEKVG